MGTPERAGEGTMVGRRRGAAGRRLAAAAVFAAVATLVVPVHRDSVPTGRGQLATVPLFNVWTFVWNADRAADGFRGYWSAPIFSPAVDAFALSEPQPAMVLAAPLLWCGVGPTTAFGAYLWLGVFLNGVAGCYALRRLALAWPAALTGGVLTQTLPLAVAELAAAQLFHLWPTVLFWAAAEAFSRRPGVVPGVACGLSFGAAAATCMHHALQAAVLAVVVSPLLLARACRNGRADAKAAILGGLAAVIVASATTLPTAVPVASALRRPDFARGEKTVQALSARPMAYVRQPASVWSRDRRSIAGHLRPGLVVCVLAIGGAACGLRSPRRGWTLLLIATLAASVTFSFGSRLQAGPVDLWEIFRDFVPGIRNVRNAYRFAFFGQLAASLLACEAIHALWSRGRRLGPAVAGVLAFACVAETWPGRPYRVGVPDVRVPAEWSAAVRSGSREGETLLHVPMGGPKSAASFAQTVRWMLYQRQHGRPLINGYSGFFPKEYWQARQAFADGVQEADLPTLVERRVRFVAVERGKTVPLLTETSDGRPVLTPVETDGPVKLYRVVWPTGG